MGTYESSQAAKPAVIVFQRGRGECGQTAVNYRFF
jgi:hypothetical protein